MDIGWIYIYDINMNIIAKCSTDYEVTTCVCLTVFACICMPNNHIEMAKVSEAAHLIFAAFRVPKVTTLCQSTESIGCSETPSPDHRSRIEFTV